MTKQIFSTQNSYIKQLVQLKEKSRERKKSGLFLIEGKREVSLAIKSNYKIETILFYPELFSISEAESLQHHGIEIIEISHDVFKKLAHRETTEGVLAVAKSKDHSLKDLKLTDKKPLILVAEAPEKPGNIGALLRTADAANLDAVIIANPKTDLYNPNIIRSSVGCVFTNTVAMGSTTEIIQFLKTNNINIYCAALQASVTYDFQDFKKPSAIVVGTEATGLSNEWLQNSTQNIIIPMQGEIDSMNVSVAAGILIFEAVRQRQNN
ncbi:RNA methyltransferase [Yeosuana sp. MJ-SS3]|uniref:RNA methyltransferase n=1 Tax=Gilvirhabdus luticola TaxID=3079858 RepID=A0ABU3U839_9FLAO|nr:RNA methyltransferase [Yeosuana sp. MJ-SS3]MDU8886578.1 RNA methyltransferase [Yeosuana sp. MJ-SS3]